MNTRDLQKAGTFIRRYFVVIDPFSRKWRRTYILISFNFKMTFSFVIVSNIAITTQKFENKVEAKIYGNGFLEFKQATQSIFGLKNSFDIEWW